jgi:hypothetical protein
MRPSSSAHPSVGVRARSVKEDWMNSDIGGRAAVQIGERRG